MSRAAIARVVGSLGGRRPDAWTDAQTVVERERVAVETVLADPRHTPIYGFDTLLGQLDGIRSPGGEELLAAHLLGPRARLDGEALRLISACKAEQLSHGGSGIAPEVFRQVARSALTPLPDAEGAWTASYGCGDVVPAAWWAAAVRGDGFEIDLAAPGTVITLINGHFVSTAAALIAAGRLVHAGERLLARHRALVHDESVWPHAGRQRPVSIRDVAPIEHAWRSGVTALGDAIERRLEGPSVNPLFAATVAGVEARSQSGFLDFTLTMALTGGLQLAALGAALAQRLVAHLSAAALARDPDAAAVQPPKVAAAIGHALRSATAVPLDFGGAESDGVEDLQDLSLLTALRLVEATERLDEALALLDGALGGDAPPVEGMLTRLLLGEEGTALPPLPHRWLV